LRQEFHLPWPCIAGLQGAFLKMPPLLLYPGFARFILALRKKKIQMVGNKCGRFLIDPFVLQLLFSWFQFNVFVNCVVINACVFVMQNHAKDLI
jgi:hypothetical protein